MSLTKLSLRYLRIINTARIVSLTIAITVKALSLWVEMTLDMMAEGAEYGARSPPACSANVRGRPPPLAESGDEQKYKITVACKRNEEREKKLP